MSGPALLRPRECAPRLKGRSGAPAATAARALACTAAQAGRFTLDDGRIVLLRPVRPDDAPAEQAFVAALSLRSRRWRFHAALKQLPASLLQAMTSVDFRDHVAIVAEAGFDDGATQLVADARYVRDDQGGAEFALAVADDWQGLGLGRSLLQRLSRHARASGIELLRGTVLADNAPMLALMRKLGARMRADPADATLVHTFVAL